MKDNSLNIGTLVKAGSLGPGIIMGEEDLPQAIGGEVRSSQLVYVFKLQRAMYLFVEYIKPMTVENRAC